MKKLVKTAILGAAVAASASAMATTDKSRPNVLVIWGDDIGYWNVSAYNRGMMGYRTPNIDRIANEGAVFTDAYAEQSCTAGRASFVTGQHSFRTGLLTIGMPGSDHGIPQWSPTVAHVFKEKGYMTAQHGKNHLGDQDKHLPTKFGFDQFFGNLYHLNAEEEPETYHYPKDPAFKKKFGPRGVLKATADGKVQDTGAMTRKRMEHADEEFLEASLSFIDKAHKAKKPFFLWHNATRMHVWTRLKPESIGVTGMGLYADGMAEHDGHVGVLLDKLDKLKIASNTVVMYSTDNGAEKFSWPDGGNSPFHGEKGSTHDGGFRVPLLVRWPGVLEGGQELNGIVHHNDWFVTFAAMLGMGDIKDKMKKSTKLAGKTFSKVHLDGYNLLPWFKNQKRDAFNSPRSEIFYFFANGDLNAVRINDFKASFAMWHGNLLHGQRVVSSWPILTHLRADPFESAEHESGLYIRWMADNMWLFVPLRENLQKFLGSIPQYNFQEGQSLNPANINYQTLKLMGVLKRLQNMPGFKK